MSIFADGGEHRAAVPASSTVETALAAASIVPGTLDRVEPSLATIIDAPLTIHLIRVSETFAIHQETIPFEHQTVRNESEPQGDTRLIQPGVNGIVETTYRRLLEDGKEVSNTPMKQTILVAPVPEIIMVGIQPAFSPVDIPGKIAYLSAGNAWIMEATSGDRRLIVDTGDLDGNIFTLSPDAQWLLFSRKGSADNSDPGAINSLWIVKTSAEQNPPISIRVKNVLRFAAWDPNKPMTVDYSTVEPQVGTPGWQANNDLQTISFSPAGVVTYRKTLIGPNPGGALGWWGISFLWSPDGKQLAYALPDQVGLVDLPAGKLLPKLTLTPVQAQGWAWVPGMSWSPDSTTLFTVVHTSSVSGIINEESKNYYLVAILPDKERAIPIQLQTGMYAAPQPSPLTAGQDFQVAFLQAIFPDRSENSPYRLEVMDQDGSNRRVIFPGTGSSGIEPQIIHWSPKPLNNGGYAIALIDGENLWLVQPGNAARQVTGDGSITRIDWK